MKGLALTLLWYQIPLRFGASHQYGLASCSIGWTHCRVASNHQHIWSGRIPEQVLQAFQPCIGSVHIWSEFKIQCGWIWTNTELIIHHHQGIHECLNTKALQLQPLIFTWYPECRMQFFQPESVVDHGHNCRMLQCTRARVPVVS